MGHGIDPTRRTSLQISFLIAEHTKFSPDLLLSKIAQTYHESDVFNTNELGDIVSRYATVAIADGTMVGGVSLLSIRNYLVRSSHHFLFVKHAVTKKFCREISRYLLR